jgi:hypothetical protein
MRKVLSIICYVFSVIALGATPLILSFSTGHESQLSGEAMIVVLCIISFMSLFPLFIGLLISWFKHGKRDTGIVLMSSAAYGFVVLFIQFAVRFDMNRTPDVYPPEMVNSINSLALDSAHLGFLWILGMAAIGYLFYRCAKRKQALEDAKAS